MIFRHTKYLTPIMEVFCIYLCEITRTLERAIKTDFQRKTFTIHFIVITVVLISDCRS